MDKIRVAAALRKHLERRLAFALKCEPQDFRQHKIGSLINLCFLVHGDGESIGGFFSTMQAVLDLIGNDLTWAQPVSDEPVLEGKNRGGNQLMFVSPNGSPILRGTGLQYVHDKIRAAFDEVRMHAEIDIEVQNADIEIELIDLDPAVDIGLTLRPLKIYFLGMSLRAGNVE